MKITRLQINNFVQVKSLDIKDLTGTTLLTGENGVGKTTILNAIAFAFGFDVRDARGVTIKNKELIGPNGDSMSVKLLIELGGRNLKLAAGVGKDRTIEIDDVDRKQPAFLGAKGIGATYAALYEAMGASQSHIECALSPRAYLLGPELGNILSVMCAGEWSLKDVELAAGEHWAYLSKLFTSPPCTNLEWIGKTCFETRTAVKKTLATAKADLVAIGEPERPTSRDGKPLEANQVSVIKEALNALQAQRDALLSELGAASATTEDKRPALDEAKSKASIDLEIAAGALEKADKAYKETQATLESAVKALSSVKASHAKATAEYDRANAELHKIESNGYKCDRCGHEMTPDEFGLIRNTANDALELAKAALEEIKINEAKSQFDGFEQANNQARDAFHAAQREYDRLVAECSRIDFEIEKLGNAKSMRNIDVIQTEIESMEERIEAGKGKLASLIAWAEKNRLEALIGDLEKEIEHLKWGIAAFHEGEFLKSRLSGSVHVFEDACNEKLSPFGYSLKVVVEGKNAQVWLQKGDHTSAPITRCSKAELVLAGYAVATAFAKSSPICIDDMDAMFSETKSKFIAQLKARDAAESPIFASGAWTAGAVDLEPITKYLTNAKVVWIGKEA